MEIFEEALTLDLPTDAMAYKLRYKKFWASNVLCGAIWKWCELCQGKIEKTELERLWNMTKSHWMDVGRAVGNIHWEFADEEKEAMPATG